MACCFAGPSSTSCRSIPVLEEEENIDFKKRSSDLVSIFEADTNYNAHRVTLEDWTKQYEASERHLLRKHANMRSARSDLYQILGLYFVFQGVIITAVAQANMLRCYNWFLPFSLCLLSSLFAFFACLQTLKEIQQFTGQHRVESALYKSLSESIEKLKQEGTSFELQKGQPELKGTYTQAEASGKGTPDKLLSNFSQFFSVWIRSYAGCVLFLLCCFSALTLISVHRILCHPGPAASPSP